MMPEGPKGEKRPADVIGAAVMVGKIATGEIVEVEEKPSAAAELGRKGGRARAKRLTPEQRKNIERSAANRRWENRED